HVGPGDPERLVVVAELGQSAELRAEGTARRLATADEADDLELRHPVVGAGMASAHVAAAGHEHAQRTVHGSPPFARAGMPAGSALDTTRARARPASSPDALATLLAFEFGLDLVSPVPRLEDRHRRAGRRRS